MARWNKREEKTSSDGNMIKPINIMTKLISLFFFAFILNTGHCQIASSNTETCPLKIGVAIPDATLFDLKSKPIKTSEILGSTPTVLIFYRGGWCPYCNIHLAELQKIEKKILDLGFQIIAVSPDKSENIQKTLDDKDLTYTILSDSNFELMSKMGLAYIDRKKRTLPVPSVYIIDSNGIVQFNYVNPNFKVRIKPELLLKAAELSVKT